MAKGEPCKAPGCKTIMKSWGNHCRRHAHRLRKYGDLNYISPNWNNLRKGQIQQMKNGYQKVFVEKYDKRVLLHRYIMEQHLGRPLERYEVIHHINGVRNDNRIENLIILKSNSEHISKFHPKRWYVNWTEYTIPAVVYKKNINDQCLVNGCSKKTRSRGLCEAHYMSHHRWSTGKH